MKRATRSKTSHKCDRNNMDSNESKKVGLPTEDQDESVENKKGRSKRSRSHSCNGRPSPKQKKTNVNKRKNFNEESREDAENSPESINNNVVVATSSSLINL